MNTKHFFHTHISWYQNLLFFWFVIPTDYLNNNSNNSSIQERFVIYPQEWMYWKVPVRVMFREYGFDSYLDKSYFVARWGGYVASVQVMSRDKLKHQVREQLLSRDKFIPSRDITFMSHRWLRYTMTAKHVNAAIDVFLVWLPVKYCDMLHHFSSAFVGYIIKHLFHENLCPITFWT